LNTANSLAGGYNQQQQQQQPVNQQGQGQRRPHQSPCPKKFQYVTDGQEWKGVIRLKNVDLSQDLELEVDFGGNQGRNQVRHSFK
jgi:hypothetical protein